MKRVKEEQGMSAFNELIKQSNFIYPETFPAIEHLTVDDEHVYVKTSKALKGKNEFIVFDKEGNERQVVRLPTTPQVPFLVRLQGDKKFFSMVDGQYVYLKLVDVSEEEEYWEVHRLPL